MATKIERHHASAFVIKEDQHSRSSRTLAGGQWLQAGTVLEEADGTKVTVYVSGTIAGVLLNEINALSGDVLSPVLSRVATVSLDELTFPVDSRDAVIAGLLAKGIVSMFSPIADTNGGGGGYVAKAVHFASGVYLDCAGLTTADSPFFSYAFFGRTAVPGTATDLLNLDNIHSNLNVGLAVEDVGTETNWFYYASDANGSNGVIDVDPADANVVGDNAWFSALGSFDIGHDPPDMVAQNYINNVSFVPPSPQQFGTASTFGFNGVSFSIPIDPNQSNIFGAVDYAIMLVWPGQFIDWSIPNNRAKIIDPVTLKPVDPALAVAAFGQPALMFDGDHVAFPVNQGPGGVFTIKTGIRLADYHGANNVITGPGPGSWPAPGAKAGSPVVGVYERQYFGDNISASFESVISVDDHIQQTSSDDYSAFNNTIIAILEQGVLTNAATSPSD
jgi:hypothetical protein